MRADNTRYLRAATRRRVDATRRRALAALRRLDNAGGPVTFDAVAREARVSRSWLYTQPDLRTEIERLRSRAHHRGTATIPDRQRASDASLQRRLQAAIERNRALEEDNKQLRDALARALGEQRTATNPARNPAQPQP